MSQAERSPLYQLAHEVVEAYAEGPAGRRLAKAVDELDRLLNEIDRGLAVLAALSVGSVDGSERPGMDHATPHIPSLIREG